MTYLPYLLIGGGLLLGALVLFGGQLKSGFASVLAKATTSTPVAKVEANTDALDLEAFGRLKARMIRLKSKEGMAAVATVGQHFLHDAGAHE
jgi:hypothetical protein